MLKTSPFFYDGERFLRVLKTYQLKKQYFDILYSFILADSVLNFPQIE